MVKSCAPCQRNARMNTKEPLTPHDVPSKPWHTLGSDLFFWNNAWYLLVADYYSKFPLVRKLNDVRSETVIKHMKSIFEENGIPEKLITGHDTQYTSSIFGDFSKTYGFEHTSTSPYHSHANGFIERNVQTVKNVLQKCKESNSDPHLAMLCLRTTPIDHNLPSPAELLNGRVYQSNLPGVSRTARLDSKVDHDANSKLQARQDLQKLYYDRSSKELPPLPPGSNVSVFNPHNKKWEPGTVRSQRSAPKSYNVELSTGSRFTRNRKHLRPSAVPAEKPTDHPDIPVDGDTAQSTSSDGPSLAAGKATVEPPIIASPQPLRRSARNIKPPDRLSL
ncbi:uncharacterized protein K02A2.6-like [Nematostella vectensis]|uniref:uncharacterized protein K02A2.6-like n=1 Tax=Nematostella vectensis TaxID=45351 RepID=UPI0013904F0B|nr:uncharacterized protein K02A2.6-like [Nematostella vectensis]